MSDSKSWVQFRVPIFIIGSSLFLGTTTWAGPRQFVSLGSTVAHVSTRALCAWFSSHETLIVKEKYWHATDSHFTPTFQHHSPYGPTPPSRRLEIAETLTPPKKGINIPELNPLEHVALKQVFQFEQAEQMELKFIEALSEIHFCGYSFLQGPFGFKEILYPKILRLSERQMNGAQIQEEATRILDEYRSEFLPQIKENLNSSFALRMMVKAGEKAGYTLESGIETLIKASIALALKSVVKKDLGQNSDELKPGAALDLIFVD